MSCSVASSEYLNELLSDKTTVSKMPKIFLHAERLLDQGKRCLLLRVNFKFNIIITAVYDK